MKFTLPALALAISSAAIAAECDRSGGSRTCGSKNAQWSAREAYCNNFWATATRYVLKDTNGYGVKIERSGSFSNQQQCWDVTANIINQCLGKKDGGHWVKAPLTVDINFCFTDF
ncbi:hypothetical protein DM02DRAFT_656481 [Periconia macrospinosa]|uniref:Uncharacterized protein n=1 Tax=Periconia macrospinosa TaxID=97972 RepID=A0A2V1DM89_9PLEO|nr:hypothetical protein DM02DRAFT_656481 [Periconia macrospinosa]